MVRGAELESEKAKRERAKRAGEVGGKIAGRGRPKEIGLATAPTAKPIEPKPRTPRTIEKAAKSAGVSERKVRQAQEVKRAAKELEKDQREQLGEVVYPWDALRARFKRQKVGTIRPTPALETCAVSDLQDLVDGGRKFFAMP